MPTYVGKEMSGMIETPPSRIYVDANPLRYFVEGHDQLAISLQRLFELFRMRPGLAVTSELTLADLLVKASAPQRRAYGDLLVWSAIFDLRPVTRNVLIQTADYRRASLRTEPNGRPSMVKLPDAIHVVTAIQSGCKRILSNDKRMRPPEGYRRVTPDEDGVLRLLQEFS